ncbi:NTP transferase domain-containing protein [Bradyrhizobium sp. C-145]|uniref:NTP transferase domain-containing protein n=1 Tax=Bradyrhizobium sp. C-145 TaxID=574727 RepID=UPI00201B959B|nr:NTP transferase domain-containing protein [Bradyrhizobium sp. C-145]UQR61353.1 NTP transferase domain-containing protein [Bradyrhizobium sp. C-145]
MKPKSCAVIPAAGRGTRLGLDHPKILTRLNEYETIWSVLRGKLMSIVDRVHVVLSPEGEEIFRAALNNDPGKDRISTSVQPRPTGMGDAVFGCHDVWSIAECLLVIWGDQVFVSPQTLSGALSLHGGSPKTVVLPVASVAQPYAEHVFDADASLIAVRQSREGDTCASGGWNDVGTFVLSVTSLKQAWDAYLPRASPGEATGEINFLPFLPFLASNGWAVRRLIVKDAREARGVNSIDDLIFFRSIPLG